MKLRPYLQILWRRKYVVVVTAVVALTIVVIGTLTATPTYVASTTLRVATPATGSADWVDYNVWYIERLLNTYAEIATSGPVLVELRQRLGVEEPFQIQAEVLPNTELMRITVEHWSPVLASDAANALAEIVIAHSKQSDTGTISEILNERLTQLEDELAQARREHATLIAQNTEETERIAALSRSIDSKEELYETLLKQYEQALIREAMQTDRISVIEPAVPTQAPSSPRRALNIALGAVLGLGGGLGLAFLLETLTVSLFTMDGPVDDEEV